MDQDFFYCKFIAQCKNKQGNNKRRVTCDNDIIHIYKHMNAYIMMIKKE